MLLNVVFGYGFCFLVYVFGRHTNVCSLLSLLLFRCVFMCIIGMDSSRLDPVSFAKCSKMIILICCVRVIMVFFCFEFWSLKHLTAQYWAKWKFNTNFRWRTLNPKTFAPFNLLLFIQKKKKKSKKEKKTKNRFQSEVAWKRISDLGSIPSFVSISSFKTYFSSVINDLDRIEFHKFFKLCIWCF